MQIFAHRGYSGKYPENTEIAFREALKAGCDGIECDVQLTRDGIPVILHDERLERVTAGKGRGLVKDFRYEELLALDFAAWKPGSYGPMRLLTLAELLQLVKDSGRDITLNLELKNSVVPYPGLEEIVLQAVHGFSDSLDIIYSSFNHRSVRKLNGLKSGIKAAPLVERWSPGLGAYVKSLGSSGIHPALEILSERKIANLQAHGLYINVYTVNRLATARRLQEQHVSGIFTDRCLEIKEALSNGKKSCSHQA